MPATPPWSPRRSAISVQLMAQFGLDHGMTLEQCLDGTGLDIGVLANPGAEVEATQELELLRNINRHIGQRPGIGLKAGLRYHLNTYGIWGFALLSSSTFLSAAHLGLRYLDLTYAFHRMTLEEHDGEAHLLLDDAAVPEDLRDFLIDRDGGGVLRIQRDLTNQPPPIRQALFRREAPADLQPYLDELGVKPLFGQVENRIVFDSRILELPLPGANPEVARRCEEQCRALLARRQVRTGLSGQIRDRLLGTPGRLPDMEQLADELHMTSRTLRRRLETEGSSYRALLDEVRQALAEELLATGAIRLEEIAERLGYGEVSNFIHAFRRWKGVTPGRFRRS
ncbi:AraC family transcriptional regulator [Pseudomonas nicosulfuronedens]|uniref:AraC family transcriptional regulator n=1 Tax=Pseudomonas nicosulfuronedens TaxID=2571105 RepID=A0A5R9RGK7_9PSED|nr:AraC family transcriptional regulator [Pseudomonas nicosulfuronedens]MDH1011214.1 AraC family transcriptional regulator [Pseudomonas nicosulfuronedens]MDH1981317.1 AraC family transcriptional regulator [Pseudomonas nicosulfuronedens]MDH2029217.1 AraC family transcriptional regulator [Pseudomonas nicosulfuronedens]TLX73781.1 AraC family transcriptional regulator [Pseudomonas nicosulfuronedens]